MHTKQLALTEPELRELDACLVYRALSVYEHIKPLASWPLVAAPYRQELDVIFGLRESVRIALETSEPSYQGEPLPFL